MSRHVFWDNIQINDAMLVDPTQPTKKISTHSQIAYSAISHKKTDTFKQLHSVYITSALVLSRQTVLLPTLQYSPHCQGMISKPQGLYHLNHQNLLLILGRQHYQHTQTPIS
jgi:hypothetical protein